MSVIARTFESQSRPGVTYTTTVDPVTRVAWCPCPGFEKSGACSHVDRTVGTLCPAPCPECGGIVELVTDGMVGDVIVPTYHNNLSEPEVRWRRAPFGACTGCEFCIEVTR